MTSSCQKIGEKYMDLRAMYIAILIPYHPCCFRKNISLGYISINGACQVLNQALCHISTIEPVALGGSGREFIADLSTDCGDKRQDPVLDERLTRQKNMPRRLATPPLVQGVALLVFPGSVLGDLMPRGLFLSAHDRSQGAAAECWIDLFLELVENLVRIALKEFLPGRDADPVELL